MKYRILQLSALGALVVLANSENLAVSDSNPATSGAEERIPNRKSAADIRRMEKQAKDIFERVGMSSSLDATETTDPVTGVDVIQELYDCGYIIPVTLEEVEAALKAAQLTPDPEDDIAAQELRHRGSYRFFLND